MRGHRHQTLHIVRLRRQAETMLRQRTPRADVARTLGLPVDVVSRIAAQIAPRPITAEDVEAARAELRTGARRCYLMLEQLREALGLPPRPSLMPAEDPEPGACAYCGEVLKQRRTGRPALYCHDKCGFYASRLRGIEAGEQITGPSAPRYSMLDRAMRDATTRQVAGLLARGAEWDDVAQEFNLTESVRHAVRRYMREQEAQP